MISMERFWRNLPYIASNGLFTFLLYPRYGWPAVLLGLLVVGIVMVYVDFEEVMYRLTRALKRIAQGRHWYLSYVIGVAIAFSVLPVVLLAINYIIYLVRGGGKGVEARLERRRRGAGR